jgi:hypothetical protein
MTWGVAGYEEALLYRGGVLLLYIGSLWGDFLLSAAY